MKPRIKAIDRADGGYAVWIGLVLLERYLA